MCRASSKALSSVKIKLNLLPLDDGVVVGRVSLAGADVVFAGFVSIGDNVRLEGAAVLELVELVELMKTKARSRGLPSLAANVEGTNCGAGVL